ncbi:hypothetical protein ABIE27_003808 [Paenibacillus sp. 4624]|uniref:Phospholipase C/D domain-containing protein n=1 Tax=Paenibacillus amylolyticus TaxID=1451 RepID=A0A5M9WUS4_PAEAM|nr:hypothetical protein [Paenibacillus amylolyticus]KAA8785396.1 hypothetical protein EC604_16250 [Paenibacillus amylolyticus]
MPWPMVHFAIAAEISSAPSPSLLLGSLAPDSIHVRTNIRSEKAKTHLMVVEHEFPTDADYQQVIESNRHGMKKDPQFSQYLCGYIAHIYTDREWTYQIYPSYEADPNGRIVYTHDVKKLEFRILREYADASRWLDQLNTAKAYEFGGLTAQEVYEYREEKLDFFMNRDNEPVDDLIIVTMDSISSFIQKTASDLSTLFQEWHVYEHLQS